MRRHHIALILPRLQLRPLIDFCMVKIWDVIAKPYVRWVLAAFKNEISINLSPNEVIILHKGGHTNLEWTNLL